MTKAQRENLLEEWGLYGPGKQREFIYEYLEMCCGYYSQDGFLHFLKDKLAIDGHCQEPPVNSRGGQREGSR